MTGLLVLFAASFGSLAAGALLAAALRARSPAAAYGAGSVPGIQPRLDRLSVALKFTGIFVISILPTVSSFWALRVPGARLGAADLAFCNSLVPPGRNVSNHFNTADWMR